MCRYLVPNQQQDQQSAASNALKTGREQILSAASIVFAEKGYQRATTREIAEKADVSEGLIYSYFESKDHLLLAILEKLANSGLDELIFEDDAKTTNDKMFYGKHCRSGMVFWMKWIP